MIKIRNPATPSLPFMNLNRKEFFDPKRLKFKISFDYLLPFLQTFAPSINLSRAKIILEEDIESPPTNSPQELNSFKVGMLYSKWFLKALSVMIRE